MKLKTILISLFVLILIGLIGYRITSNKAEAGKNNNKSDKKPPTMVDAIILSEKDFLNVISSKGANNLYFSAPTQNKSGILQIKTTTTLDICDITCIPG